MRNFQDRMTSMHKLCWVLVGVVMICTGCMTLPISYVAPGDPVAVLENVYRQEGPSSNPTMPLFINVAHVDGRGHTHFKLRSWNRRAWAFELPPGPHILDVRVVRQLPKGEHDTTFTLGQPLTIELEARAGHNYRVCAHAYDAKMVSLYIEDIITGEVVSGHRPEKPVSP